MPGLKLQSAIKKINEAGIALVYPIANTKEPDSLWYHFFPRKKMRWEWDETGDDSVADLWHLRARLSSCQDVVYAKWYKGRATFFSRKVFATLLRSMNTVEVHTSSLSENAQKVLQNLEEDSPQSPRMLRSATELTGKAYESAFNRALKELWNKLLIVGFGEIDDGAFPSLAIGATKLLYEELWSEALQMTPQAAQAVIDRYMPTGSDLRKFYDRLKKARQSESTRHPERSEGSRRSFASLRMTD